MPGKTGEGGPRHHTGGHLVREAGHDGEGEVTSSGGAEQSQLVSSDLQGVRVVHLDVEDCSEELRRQQSYAIKNQRGTIKIAPYAGSLCSKASMRGLWM